MTEIFNIRNQVVFISGAAGLIGSFLSDLFARHGALVVMADLNLEKCREHATQMAGQVLPISLDVTSEEATQAAVAAAVAE
jgi:NAD(P)-dependent dehydrogenase (short-subunit alcohol dehydrogenase family)